MSKIFNHVAIPCEDYERAFTFYNEITGGLIKHNPNVPFPMAYFVDKDNNQVGHLFLHPGFKPSSDGVLVYMELAKDLNEILEKINLAGGKVILPKTLISSEKGYWAVFNDCEGNKLALHSNE